MGELITRHQHTDFSVASKIEHTKPLTVDSIYHVIALPDYDIIRSGIEGKLILAATLSGHGLICLGDQILEQKPGDVILFEPSCDFTYKCIGTNWTFWWFEFHLTGSTLWNNLTLNTVHYLPLNDTMLHLCRESLSSLKLQDTRTASYLLVSLLCLLDKECHKTIAPQSTMELFHRADQYIHLNLATATVKSTAAHLNVCEHTLLNIFQSLLGMRTAEYIRKVKMDMAYHLLTTGDLSIREIADQLGYADQFIFSKSFRRQFGISPQNCRKHLKDSR